MDGTEYITLKEAAELSGYSPDYIGQLIRRGKLPGKQVYANVAWVTTKEAIDSYMGQKKKPVQEETVVLSWIDKLLLIPGQWERTIRTITIGIVVVSSLFLLLLLHIFSSVLDDRMEAQALKRVAGSEHSSETL